MYDIRKLKNSHNLITIFICASRRNGPRNQQQELRLLNLGYILSLALPRMSTFSHFNSNSYSSFKTQVKIMSILKCVPTADLRGEDYWSLYMYIGDTSNDTGSGKDSILAPGSHPWL